MNRDLSPHVLALPDELRRKIAEHVVRLRREDRKAMVRKLLRKTGEEGDVLLILRRKCACGMSKAVCVTHDDDFSPDVNISQRVDGQWDTQHYDGHCLAVATSVRRKLLDDATPGRHRFLAVHRFDERVRTREWSCDDDCESMGKIRLSSCQLMHWLLKEICDLLHPVLKLESFEPM